MSDGFFLDPSELQKVARWVEGKKKALSPERARGMYQSIGMYMRQQTIRNFENETDPGGNKWEGLKEVTQERRRKGSKSVADKILQDTGALKQSIGYRFVQDGVIVGTVNSVMKYAKAHQYGIPRTMIKQVMANCVSKKGTPFTRRMNVPWGPVPARPFVGLSQANLERIHNIIKRYIILDSSGGAK